MNDELEKRGGIYEIAPGPANIWVLTGLINLLLLMAIYNLFQPGPGWWVLLIFSSILACANPILFFGMRSEKVVLTEDQLYYRYFFITKLVPLSSITSTKLSLKPLALEIVVKGAHKKISLNLALYDPAECRQMSSLLINLLAERTSTTDGM